MTILTNNELFISGLFNKTLFNFHNGTFVLIWLLKLWLLSLSTPKTTNAKVHKVCNTLIKFWYYKAFFWNPKTKLTFFLTLLYRSKHIFVMHLQFDTTQENCKQHYVSCLLILLFLHVMIVLNDQLHALEKCSMHAEYVRVVTVGLCFIYIDFISPIWCQGVKWILNLQNLQWMISHRFEINAFLMTEQIHLYDFLNIHVSSITLA